MSCNTPSAQQADFPRNKVRYYAALCPKLQYGKSNSARLELVSAGGAGGRISEHQSGALQSRLSAKTGQNAVFCIAISLSSAESPDIRKTQMTKIAQWSGVGAGRKAGSQHIPDVEDAATGRRHWRVFTVLWLALLSFPASVPMQARCRLYPESWPG